MKSEGSTGEEGIKTILHRFGIYDVHVLVDSNGKFIGISEIEYSKPFYVEDCCGVSKPSGGYCIWSRTAGSNSYDSLP